jgi:hypothetical protein
MNAVHPRDEINPFASASYATYAELEVEELAPVVARPAKDAAATGAAKRFVTIRTASQIGCAAIASRFVNLRHFRAGVAPASVRLRMRR